MLVPDLRSDGAVGQVVRLSRVPERGLVPEERNQPAGAGWGVSTTPPDTWVGWWIHPKMVMYLVV